MMFESIARRHSAGLAWNDIEALPLYGASMLLIGAVAYGLADAGPALQTMSAKVAVIAGCLGLRWAWLGMNGPND